MEISSAQGYENIKTGLKGPVCGVSVIIVNWNVKDLLVRCINSVLEKTAGKDYEIIVVDNNSSDGTGEAVKHGFPSVKLIESDKNLGFAGGCNLGAKNAGGRYFFFLNPDAELKEGALDKLVSFLDANSDAAVVGAKLLWPDGSYQDSYRRFFGFLFSILEVFEFHYYFPGNWLYRRSQYGFEVFKEPSRVDWVVGAAFAVRREAFEKAGGFDEKIFMYAEDTDLCRTITDLGGKIYFLPGAEVVHYKGKSSRLSSVRSVEYYKSLYYYHSKHSGSLKAMGFRGALALWSVFYILILIFKFIFRRDREITRLKISDRWSLLKWSLLKCI